MSFKLRSLPVIDITPYLFPPEEHKRGPHGGRQSTSAALHAACLTYGFFYLDISSYVTPGEMEELAVLARQFFALPEEEKDKLSLANQDGARGYQRLKENVTNGKADNHEGLDFYAPVADPDKSKPLWGENQWPSNDIVPGFREKYENWVEKMKVLGMIVMEAMSVGLGMTKDEWEDLKSKVDDSFWSMRMIGYPSLPNDYDGFSCGAHKDYGCLTFLYADPTPDALQVFLPQPELLTDAATSPVPSSASSGLAPGAASAYLDANGNASIGSGSGLSEEGGEPGVWISADPLPGCVVCNIGEMWEVWTNGLYKSTLHRVLHRGSNYRVSIPFFFEPNFTARVEPLAAALRLQKDSIQPAYVYDGTPQSHADDDSGFANGGEGSGGDASALTQRLEALLDHPPPSEGTTPPMTAGLYKGTPLSAASPAYLDAPPEYHRSQHAHVPHTHAHAPLSVEARYAPVMYGDFLVQKVGGNFAVRPGKGRYD